MRQLLDHPQIEHTLRTGYPFPEEDEVLNDEDDEDCESEIWGDEFEDRAYEERRERELFG